ncbi:MAG: hypothetical protein ITG00_08540 [Flavobacterium sp.]|nr:hypothetical protein [Flavobacterium sp.]
MENNNTTTLTVRVCGSIETPPAINRETFRQSVIDTILQVMKTQEVAIEYIGYQPDRTGLHHLESFKTEFEDCVYVSFNVASKAINEKDYAETKSSEDIVNAFVDIFEHKTHRHLEIDSTVLKKGTRQRMIELSSDWQHYLKHG